MLNNLHLFNKGVRVRPRSKAAIYEMAHKVRELAGVGIHQSFDVATFLEFTMPKATRYEFVHVSEPQSYMGETEAAVSPDEKLMKIRDDVLDNLRYGNSRARFTIAHEFGHYFLHKGEGVPFNRGNPTAHKTFEDSEWQANTFAAELLAPLAGCKGLSVYEIAEKYNISSQCATLRYKECNSR